MNYRRGCTLGAVLFATAVVLGFAAGPAQAQCQNGSRQNSLNTPMSRGFQTGYPSQHLLQNTLRMQPQYGNLAMLRQQQQYAVLAALQQRNAQLIAAYQQQYALLLAAQQQQQYAALVAAAQQLQQQNAQLAAALQQREALLRAR